MLVSEALTEGAAKLSGSTTPELDARVLLGFVLSLSPTQLVLWGSKPLTSSAKARYFRLVDKRAKSEPIAYIVGGKEFYGFWFEVNRHTLIPRPETEAIVSFACELAKKRGIQKITEIGTGSGIIAITLARLLPQAQITATDVSAEALEIARRNAKLHKVASRVRFIQSDLLGDLAPTELIVANLPYLKADLPITADLNYEPRSALFDGSKDGLGLYRKLFEQIGHGLVVIELGSAQAAPMSKWLRQTFGNKVKTAPVPNIDGSICGLSVSLDPSQTL